MKYQCGVGGPIVSHTTSEIILWFGGKYTKRNCLKALGKLRITGLRYFKLEINHESNHLL